MGGRGTPIKTNNPIGVSGEERRDGEASVSVGLPCGTKV